MSLFRTLGDEGLEIHYRKGKKVIEVDTKKAKFRGMTVGSLGGYGRHKFENLLVIESNMNDRTPVKFLYKF
jgi:hypothetical protein